MKLDLAIERWPLKGTFRTARRSFDLVETLMVTLRSETAEGRGEAVGVDYLDETAQSLWHQIEAHRHIIEQGIDREALQSLLPAGGARNALDCALWDLDCKQRGRTIWDLTGIDPAPVTTAYTIVIDKPARMAQAAAASTETLLKIKITAAEASRQVAAVREARPDARLIVDANQDFSLVQLRALIDVAGPMGVELIEQPLPAGEDSELDDFVSPIPLCADESFQTAQDLPRLAQRYSFVNLKLDKIGGLTAGLAIREQAAAEGLGLMTGCWAATSLAMAPAFVLSQQAAFADIDGPLLLAADREHGMSYERGVIAPPDTALWG